MVATNTAVTDDMESPVLAIPGSFNTGWGRDLWIDVSSQRCADPDIISLPVVKTPSRTIPHLP